jgi:hypothetical protein
MGFTQGTVSLRREDYQHAISRPEGGEAAKSEMVLWSQVEELVSPFPLQTPVSGSSAKVEQGR